MSEANRDVVIEWSDPDGDWHWFRVVEFAGDWVCLVGRPSPDGDQHCGPPFWAHRSEIREMTVEEVKR